MEPEHVEDIMGQMPYGLYIIGSSKEDEVNGMMADWVMQVSFSPHLVAVAFENDARTLQNIRDLPFFTVNFLSQDEHNMELAGKFAQPYLGAKVKGRSRPAAAEVHHKLEDIAHRKTSNGCPVLAEAMAWLECEAEQFVSTGDHTLVVGKIVDGRLERQGEALTSTYTGWNYSG